MTGGVKIPVEASVGSVTDGLNKIPAKVEEVSRRINKFKWQVVDLKALASDLKAAERLVADFQRRMGPIGLGGGLGVPGSAVPPGPLYRPPAAPSVPAGGGGRGGGNGGRGGPGAYTHAPQWWNVGQSFMGGVGGGFGQIGSYGVRGGLAGYNSGGFGGAGIGLMRGLGIGALAFGALKLGQGVSEGYDLNKERLGTLDSLKRQLGDVGVSFERLKTISNMAADGLQINSKEAAELALQFNRLSRGHGGIGGLTDATRVSVGFSRAYGMDPGAGVGFFGGMANMDRRQNNRELALLMAEAIEKSGMSARADEVLQAIQGYASSVSRMSLGTGGVANYAGAYSSLMGMSGMTSDTAAAILGSANSAMMNMGGAGEASQNFTLMAMQRYGRIDPVSAMALSEGGLFGTRGSVFSKGGAIAQFLGEDNLPGGDMDVTNFDVIRKAILGLGGDKKIQLNTAKRYFQTNSHAQAAALMNLKDGGMGRLKQMLDEAGVSLNDVSASGIQALAKLPDGATREQVRAIATANREETEHTKLQDIAKTLDDIKINTGDVLGKGVTKTADGVTWLAEHFGMKKSVPASDPASNGFVTGAGGAKIDWSGGGQGAPYKDRYAEIRAKEAQLGLPAGILKGVWGAESSFGTNTGKSSAGAMGNFQFMPSTAKDYGVKVGDFSSELDGAGRLLKDLYKKRGSWDGALRGYNGVVKNLSAGDDYVRKVQKYGEFSLGGDGLTQMPFEMANRNIRQSTTLEYDLLLNPLNAESRQPMGPQLSNRISLPKSSGTAAR